MLSLSVRRLFYVCDKVIVRNMRGRRLDPNPGLQRRLEAFREEGLQIQDDDAEEFVEQSESDFYKVGDAYDEHLKERLKGKIDQRHQIVKQKYFKENMPNLLTWSEKEQIRHLCSTEPDEWTPDKIAESFPVTIAVVKKLIKFPWKPATEERIARHDASAMRNWRELEEGTLDIPEDVRNHFIKFSKRTIPPLNKNSIKIDLTPKDNIGEFERIVQKCAAKDEKSEERLNKDLYSSKETGLAVGTHKVKQDPTRVTLDELTAKIKKRFETGNEINEPDKLMLNAVNNTEPEELTKEIELFSENDKEKELTEYKEKDDKVLNVMDFPLRIRIPKKAYKNGATFKVNDCYYDHDGKFLYRVMGMSTS